MGSISFREQDGTQTVGPYGAFPNDTPKYNSTSGRTPNSAALTVARMFLTESAVAASPGMPAMLTDFFKNKTGAYVGFILNQVTETRSEKSEIIPLSGDGFASYFFGENPSVYTFDGYFLNTKYSRWRDLFDLMYKHIFRGSKVAGHRKLVRIAYDERIVSGVLISINQVLTSAGEAYSQYQFQILVYDNAILLDSTSTLNSDHFLGETQVFTTNALTLLPLEANKDYTRTASIVRPPNALKPKAGTKDVCAKKTARPEVSGVGGANPETSGALVIAAQIGATNCDLSKQVQITERELADLEKKRDSAKTEQERDSISAEINTRAKFRDDLNGQITKNKGTENYYRNKKAIDEAARREGDRLGKLAVAAVSDLKEKFR